VQQVGSFRFGGCCFGRDQRVPEAPGTMAAHAGGEVEGRGRFQGEKPEVHHQAVPRGGGWYHDQDEEAWKEGTRVP